MVNQKISALNKLPFVGSKNLTEVSFPFYMIVKSNENFLMPSKWDEGKKVAAGDALNYKRGDVIKVVAMETNADSSKMLITDDGKSIWAEGLKPEHVMFSESIAPKEIDAVTFKISAGNNELSKELSAQYANVPMWASALPLVGIVGGILYAYKQKKTGWSVAGYAVVGMFIASAPHNYFALDTGKVIGKKL